MSSLEYRDSSPHWVVHSTLTDETPAGDNAAEALLRYWMERNGVDYTEGADDSDLSDGAEEEGKE